MHIADDIQAEPSALRSLLKHRLHAFCKSPRLLNRIYMGAILKAKGCCIGYVYMAFIYQALRNRIEALSISEF